MGRGRRERIGQYRKGREARGSMMWLEMTIYQKVLTKFGIIEKNTNSVLT